MINNMLCKCTVCRWCREEIGFFGIILEMLGFRKGEVPKEKVYEKDVVLFINAMQIIFILLGIVIFSKGLF